MISDAVRKNALTKTATDAEIRVTVMKYLQMAGDRCGGRNQRAKNKEAAQGEEPAEARD